MQRHWGLDEADTRVFDGNGEAAPGWRPRSSRALGRLPVAAGPTNLVPGSPRAYRDLADPYGLPRHLQIQPSSAPWSPIFDARSHATSAAL
jgi:hypothetical protein